MTDAVSGLQVLPEGHGIVRGDMHVEEAPAGLFVPVPVQVLHHGAFITTHNEARRSGYDPITAGRTPERHAAGCEVESAPGRAGVPRAGGPAGEIPRMSILEGQAQLGLGEVGRHERFKGPVERVAEESFIGGKQTLLAHGPLPLAAREELRHELLNRSRSGIYPWACADRAAVAERPVVRPSGTPGIEPAIEFIRRPGQLAIQAIASREIDNWKPLAKGGRAAGGG